MTARASETTLSALLQQKLMALLKTVEGCELYQVMINSDTSAQEVRTILKHILLEVFSYGPHITEATFTAIGRFPKSRPDLMKPMIIHDLSEVDQRPANTRRHSLATHLLENGMDTSIIQAPLGHSRIDTPARFAQVSPQVVAATVSPFDLLEAKPVATKPKRGK